MPFTAGSICLALLVVLAACRGESKGSSFQGTYKMGEKVQAGPLIYTILEASWKERLSDDATAKPPSERFLLVKLSITNSGASQVSVPALSLVSPSGKSYLEITDGLQNLSGWLGMLRIIKPSQTEQGLILFDAPIGAYKLEVTDGGEIEREITAHVEIPADIQANVD